ncbi:hypothetical protein [Proteus sp. G2660]|uniref:hypothetical protein n=1 Tax=Proteus sp. G2660 TaxID=2698873 RepID=UPI0013775C1E|nr:hypothetical protein [Proteus sp. G2660]NBM98599.1 hypothetical protein [Proteus sp. G2660]
MKKLLLIVIVLIVAFLGYGAIMSSTPEGKEKAKARNAIDYCWKEYDKKSITNEQRRFIASTCEKMESDFRSRYGVNP